MAGPLRDPRLRAAGLVLPLVAFIGVTFVAPVASLLVRSVYAPVVADALPETLAALSDWDGQGAPAEAVYAAAARELLEETGLRARAGEVVAVHSNFHDPERLTVGIWFAGEDVEGEPVPADGELSEIRYFDPASPPPLAFPTDALVLTQIARERAG